MTDMNAPATPERPSRKACIEVATEILAARKCWPSLIKTYQTLARKAIPTEWDNPETPPVVPGTPKKWLPWVSVNRTQLTTHLRILERHGVVDRLLPPAGGRYGPGPDVRGLSLEPSVAGYPLFLEELAEIQAQQQQHEKLVERFLEVRSELVRMRHKLYQVDRGHELIAEPLRRINWPRTWSTERIRGELDEHLQMLSDVVKAVARHQPEEEAGWHWNHLSWRMHRLKSDMEMSGSGATG